MHEMHSLVFIVSQVEKTGKQCRLTTDCMGAMKIMGISF